MLSVSAVLAISIALAFAIGYIIYSYLFVLLSSEMVKKFRFMNSFISASNQLVVWHFAGTSGHKPGMHNIVLRGSKQFCTLVGFRLVIPVLGDTGFDYYGFVQSDDSGVAVVSTWLGRKAVEFQFFVNCDLDTNRITASSSDDDQHLLPHAVYPPHWWQRLGFYA